jgi:hypothetical protein
MVISGTIRSSMVPFMAIVRDETTRQKLKNFESIFHIHTFEKILNLSRTSLIVAAKYSYESNP